MAGKSSKVGGEEMLLLPHAGVGSNLSLLSTAGAKSIGDSQVEREVVPSSNLGAACVSSKSNGKGSGFKLDLDDGFNSDVMEVDGFKFTDNTSFFRDEILGQRGRGRFSRASRAPVRGGRGHVRVQPPLMSNRHTTLVESSLGHGIRGSSSNFAGLSLVCKRKMVTAMVKARFVKAALKMSYLVII